MVEVGLAAVRIGLVVAALVVALLPIGANAVGSFCPESATTGTTGDEVTSDAPSDVAPSQAPSDVAPSQAPSDAASETAAGTADLVVAAPRGLVLAEIVEPSDAEVPPVAPEETPSSTDGSEAPSTTPLAPDEQVVCGEAVSQCFPPLVSAIVRLGQGSCGEEAMDRLQGDLVPAFVFSSLLLGGAWALRPRFGGGVISRY